MERLAPVPFDDAGRQSVDDAVEWIRNVRRHGMSWDVRPRPSVEELWPNMGFQEDSPWHHAKVEIAEDLGEVTSLWQVGVPGRQAAPMPPMFTHGVPPTVRPPASVSQDKSKALPFKRSWISTSRPTGHHSALRRSPPPKRFD